MRTKQLINRKNISDAFFNEIKKCLSNFSDLTITQKITSYDNLNRDVLPLVQVIRVEARPTHNSNGHQKWTFLYKVSVAISKDDRSDGQYDYIDDIFDKLAIYFNTAGLNVNTLNDLVAGVYVVGQEDDEGIFSNICAGEMYFEVVAV